MAKKKRAIRKKAVRKKKTRAGVKRAADGTISFDVGK
jgi:hypothetical protein